MQKVLLVVLCLVGVTWGYSYVKGPVSKEDFWDPAQDGHFACPGLYCGRSDLNSTHYSNCGKCDRGFKVGKLLNNSHSLCMKCDEKPEKNDWFFLAFHVVIVLVMQWAAIDYAARRRNFTKEVLTLHFCALIEVAGAALITILVLDPVGELGLTSCKVDRLQDWYTFFQNPTPNYEETLHCTQEAGT